MRTQHDTAQLILGRGAGCVMTVKANMPALHRQLRKPPWSRIPTASSVSKDHGRRARPTIKVALAPAWIGLDGAAQVAQLRRTVVKKGKKTVEAVYPITSGRDADPETPAAWARRHRHIETSSTGSATSLTRKTSPRSGQETHPASWRRCEVWPSASCAWTAIRTSPPPTAITPATRSGRSSYFKLHEYEFAGSLPAGCVTHR